MAKILSIRLDPALAQALAAHATRANLTESQVARDLLRHALGTVQSPRDAGWHEGFFAGANEIKKRMFGISDDNNKKRGG